MFDARIDADRRTGVDRSPRRGNAPPDRGIPRADGGRGPRERTGDDRGVSALLQEADDALRAAAEWPTNGARPPWQHAVRAARDRVHEALSHYRERDVAPSTAVARTPGTTVVDLAKMLRLQLADRVGPDRPRLADFALESANVRVEPHRLSRALRELIDWLARTAGPNQRLEGEVLQTSQGAVLLLVIAPHGPPRETLQESLEPAPTGTGPAHARALLAADGARVDVIGAPRASAGFRIRFPSVSGLAWGASMLRP